MQFQKLADIDLDLPWDRRDEVIQYVFDRYGRGHVAMIGAFNTFQGRSTLIDIAKVYGIPEREVQRFTENLPYFAATSARPCATRPNAATCPPNRSRTAPSSPWRSNSKASRATPPCTRAAW